MSSKTLSSKSTIASPFLTLSPTIFAMFELPLPFVLLVVGTTRLDGPHGVARTAAPATSRGSDRRPSGWGPRGPFPTMAAGHQPHHLHAVLPRQPVVDRCVHLLPEDVLAGRSWWRGDAVPLGDDR